MDKRVVTSAKVLDLNRKRLRAGFLLGFKPIGKEYIATSVLLLSEKN